MIPLLSLPASGVRWASTVADNKENAPYFRSVFLLYYFHTQQVAESDHLRCSNLHSLQIKK